MIFVIKNAATFSAYSEVNPMLITDATLWRARNDMPVSNYRAIRSQYRRRTTTTTMPMTALTPERLAHLLLAKTIFCGAFGGWHVPRNFQLMFELVNLCMCSFFFTQCGRWMFANVRLNKRRARAHIESLSNLAGLPAVKGGSLQDLTGA